MMTIVIHFHQARYRDFNTYYTKYVQVYLHRAFPKLISYERFVQLLSLPLFRGKLTEGDRSATSKAGLPIGDPEISEHSVLYAEWMLDNSH